MTPLELYDAETRRAGEGEIVSSRLSEKKRLLGVLFFVFFLSQFLYQFIAKPQLVRQYFNSLTPMEIVTQLSI